MTAMRAEMTESNATSMRADARLALPALLAWIVLGVLLAAPTWLFPSAAIAWSVAALALTGAVLLPRRRGLLSTVAVVAAVAGLVLSSAATQEGRRHPAELVDAASRGRHVRLIVRLDAMVTGARTAPVEVTIQELEVGGVSRGGIRAPAVLFGSVPEAGLGSTVRVDGRVALTEAGDRAAFLIFARGSPRVVAPPPWYLDWANGLRARFLAGSAELPGDGGALLPGLAIGDTSRVSNELDAAMKATSLSHLTAVSGANCAVVVGLVLVGGAALGMSRRARVGAALVVLVGFVVLVTPEASVLRAAVMAAIVLAALASGRPTRGVPVLALAVVVLLSVDPWLAREYGFILSVLATAGLLVLSAPIAAALGRVLPRALAVVVSIPIAAQLACQPVLILLNPFLPVYAVPANLLSEPAAPVATVLGLAACLVFPVVEPLGRALAAIAWVPSAWISSVAMFFAGLPGAQAPWLAGAIGVLLLGVLTAALVAVVALRRGRLHRGVAIVLSVSLVAYLGVLAGSAVGRRLAVPADWQIAACDVGQGDAMLVRSEGRIALIDTGPDPVLLARCLETLEIERIDLLVLTHFDLDHVGGVAAVAGAVERAIVGPAGDADDRRLRDALTAAGAEVAEVSRGDSGLLGELRWEVLWPPTRLGTLEPGNAASVTVGFEGVGACVLGCLRSLFLGDLGEESQLRMAGVARPDPVDVVKVAHHGSADQSAALYSRVRATVGLIGVGAENSYGHPTERLLGMLAESATTVARTDRDGMILLSPTRAPATGEWGVRVWTER